MAKGLERCFEFQEGRLCLRPEILIEILKSLKDTPSEGMSNLLMIVTNLTISSTTSWVIDFGSSVHLCTSMQDLKECRRLRLGEMTLQVGNGARVASMTAGTNPLRLPSDLDLVLKNYYYVSAASRNLISVSCLALEGYIINFFKDHCNILYERNKVASGFLINSLYQLYVDVSIFNFEQNVNAIKSK